jgi:branched-chain amino acid transport system substrate-binding protein
MLIAATSLMIAACSSSGGNGGGQSTNAGSTADAGSASAGAKPQGAPIKLGVIGSFTGSQASSLGLADDGAHVWEQWINANGGINGHPVELIIKDDALDPAKALQAAKELVEQDHVMAIIGDNSLVDSSWASYISQKGVPVIGGNPTQSTFVSNADFFPTGTNVVALIFGQFVRMKEAGLTKMGLLYCAEAPTCAQLQALGKAAAGIVGGVQLAASAKVAATQPSYDAECIAMKNAGVDGLFIAHGAAIVVTIAEGCAKVGFTPTEVNQATVIADQALKSPQFEGALLTSPNTSPTDESVPGIKQYLDAVKKYNPSMITSPQFTQNVLWSWLGGQMFAKAAQLGKIGPTSTPADVRAGLYQVKDETLGGVIPPVTYTSGKPTVLNCWFNLSIKSGKLINNSTKPACPTPAQETDLKKLTGG